MRQVFGSLACGAVLLAGVAACSEDPKTSASNPAANPAANPATNESSAAAVAAPEQKDPAALLKQGIEQGQAGQPDQAKASFEKVLSLQADNKFAWFNLGYLAQSRNATDEAIADYDRALAIDGSYRPAMYNKAMLLEGQQPGDAVALYRQIISADSRAATAYVRLGLMLVKQGDTDGAQAAFTSALKVDPRLASAVPEEYRSTKSPEVTVR